MITIKVAAPPSFHDKINLKFLRHPVNSDNKHFNIRIIIQSSSLY